MCSSLFAIDGSFCFVVFQPVQFSMDQIGHNIAQLSGKKAILGRSGKQGKKRGKWLLTLIGRLET